MEENNEIREIKSEENNNYEKNAEVTDDSVKYSLKSLIAMCLAVFAGSFLAMYFVADRYFSHRYGNIKLNKPYFEQRLPIPKMTERDVFRDFPGFEDEFAKMPDINDRDFFERMHNFDMIPEKLDMPLFMNSPVKIKTERTNNKYKIIVSLKPFENNPDKIKYEIHDNIITVSGKSETNRKNVNTSVSFSQDFVMPDNADGNAVEKIHEKNKLIISVPIKKD